MRRLLGTATSIVAALSLAACGGSTVAVVWSSGSGFIVWVGNSRGDHVFDGRNQGFAFSTENRCLYNFQTGRRNDAFCLLPDGDSFAYGAFRGVISNARAADGSCVATMTDAASGNVINIDLDAYGREVVIVTARRMQQCAA